jgi:ribosomal protein L37E
MGAVTMGKELRDWYAQHGICAECGRESAAPHRKYCWECLYKRNERHHKYIANMSEERKQAERKKACERTKKKYAERKAAGKCVRCGKKPAEPGKVMCTMCLKKDAKRHMEKRRENGALPRYMFGDGYHCVTCGKDIDNGKKQCDECQYNAAHALEIARGKIKGGFRNHKLVFGKTGRKT